MFLVTMCCQMDDIPLALFTKREDAIWFIQGHSEAVPQDLLDMLKIDQPITFGLTIWDFSSLGAVERREHIRWFETEHDQREAARAASEQ